MNCEQRLELARQLYASGSYDNETIEVLFPELKESEDERIRKDIIHLVKKSHEQGGYALHKYEADEMLAWLEKQGQKSQGKSAFEAAKEEKVDNQNCVNPADKSKIKPKFKTGDRVIGIVSGMPYFITEVCDDHYNTESGCIIMFCSQDNFKLYEQNPAWSEEDENKINLFLQLVEGCDNYEELSDWLVSLKDRVQPKQEWSKEDENRINRLIAYFEDKESFTAEDDIVYSNWLKSLRLQTTWKPSYKQISVLEFIMDGIKDSGRYAVLKSIHEQLKKLRGE